ncbi:metallopeptidase family protein [Consotaella salsifontis]|uniref:Predicted Zn-dependent protease, minimal metalloprotease (MMP)-like domain n=1 Tax=Consotaella salsifontis TaxID=1365950 RepID=A0A1T4QY80_9HYPH|nr:metallopeptidase family protein [Consotaella salsifontis]SKA08517.1 Predicted Zn-dependent protease, minimal metalloprotease (MMP)-like domain [Consotaella salsifontis]
MGRIDNSGDWSHRLSPSLDEIEALAIEAYGNLPVELRTLCQEIRFVVADFPDDEVIEEMELDTPFDILGLFEGRPYGASSMPQTGEMTNRILLYRRPILDYWAENEESLGAVVTHVLVHEIGHHFGLSDENMEALEEAADNP